MSEDKQRVIGIPIKRDEWLVSELLDKPEPVYHKIEYGRFSGEQKREIRRILGIPIKFDDSLPKNEIWWSGFWFNHDNNNQR